MTFLPMSYLIAVALVVSDGAVRCVSWCAQFTAVPQKHFDRHARQKAALRQHQPARGGNCSHDDKCIAVPLDIVRRSLLRERPSHPYLCTFSVVSITSTGKRRHRHLSTPVGLQ